MLGVPGLMAAARAGNVTIANAVGNGVADDKAVYAYVPELIRYYLGEEPILPNVTTYLLWDADQRADVLERLDQLVVKPVAAVGRLRHAHRPGRQRRRARRVPRAASRPTPGATSRRRSCRSRAIPTLVDDHLEGRHIDLRPFVLSADEVEVIPGGLTRVALRKGSLVVNSSQGGGSKDTWVLAADEAAEAVATPTRPTAEMLARHAESLFWAGRYIERAEDTAAHARRHLPRAARVAAAEAERAWRDLLAVLHLTRGVRARRTAASAP